jgi:hypothetical protein
MVCPVQKATRAIKDSTAALVPTVRWVPPAIPVPKEKLESTVNRAFLVSLARKASQVNQDDRVRTDRAVRLDYLDQLDQEVTEL